jgi:DNA-binding NtrC family response regulator
MRSNSRRPAVAGLTAETRELLMKYSWPGNIRELEHAIQHAMSLGDSKYIRPLDLPQPLNGQNAAAAAAAEVLTYAEEKIRFQKLLFAKTLTLTNWNFPEAAKLLGISEKHLYQRTKELGIQKPDS